MALAPIVLAVILCSGIINMILLANQLYYNAQAQLVELPPLLPPPSNDTGNDTSDDLEQPNDNSTAPEPPAEPPAEPPTEPPGNETSNRTPILQPTVLTSTNPCIEYDDEAHTVTIICDADIYELFQGLRDNSITQQLGAGQIMINTNITVNDGAIFSIHPSGGINYVKLSGGSGIIVDGTIHINNMTMTSWDPINNTVIHQDATGSIERAFLLLRGSEDSHIYNSELGYMGYNATGYRGVDLIEASNNFAIMNSSFHHMWYGFYSNAAYNVTIDSTEYWNSHQYAIDPHTGTYNMTVSNSTIHHNAVGLVCSLDCHSILFENNTIYENEGTGIFFSRNTIDSIARYNTIYNQTIGIALSESSNNLIYGNNITSTGRAIFFNDPENPDDGRTTNNRAFNNTISNSAVGIAAFRTTDNIASNNLLDNITRSHYRLNASSSLTISNQTFGNVTIEAQAGNNLINIANSSFIEIDGVVYDAASLHAIELSNQTIAVNSVVSNRE